jgi:hypothetical protein
MTGDMSMITVHTAKPEDVWPGGGCPYPSGVVDEIFRVAKTLTPDEIRRALPSSSLSPWYQAFWLAEQRVLAGAQNAEDAQARDISELRREVANLNRALEILLGEVGSRGNKLCNKLLDVLGDAIGRIHREHEAEIVKQQAATKQWLQEKLAALDQRITDLPQPRDGLPGVPGPPGRDGVPGKDGVDGLGVDDFEVEYDGERRVTFKLANGERTKASQIVMPVQIYREIYKVGQAYEQGDSISYGGSIWVALVGTSEKPGSGKDWRLATKHGRDGRDGKSAYEIAVEKGGFKGTEQEWLRSLQGKEGKPGRDLTLGGRS